MNLFTMTKTVAKSLFTGPATRKYPQRLRTYTEITRGRILIEIGSCIYCGMCSRNCPTDAITVARERRTWTIDRLCCTACGRCVEVCPVKCLRMDNLYSSSVTERGSAVFTATAPVPGDIDSD